MEAPARFTCHQPVGAPRELPLGFVEVILSLKLASTMVS